MAFQKEVSLMFHRFNRLALALTLYAILGTASSAHAGGSIFAGVDFPTGDFDKVADTGWTIGGYYTFDMLPIVDIGGTVAYNDFNSSLWEIQALGQLKFLMLKGFLGLGVANYESVNAKQESERKNDFSWQLGVSMDILMVEGRLGYHQVTLDGSSLNWVGLTVGLKF
jgi:hypothetical protein